MNDLFERLSKLKNFNLIKYTGHYALTIDRGMGAPIIIQGNSLDEIADHLRSYAGTLR